MSVSEKSLKEIECLVKSRGLVEMSLTQPKSWCPASEATEAAKAAATTARDAVERVNVQAAEITGEDALAAADLARADADMDKHGAMTAEIDVILADRAAVELTRQSMERFKIELIGRIRPALSRKASELLREMTDGEYADLVLR